MTNMSVCHLSTQIFYFNQNEDGMLTEDKSKENKDGANQIFYFNQNSNGMLIEDKENKTKMVLQARSWQHRK